MKKKVVSVFLALVLCLTLLPAAWAEGTDAHAQTGTDGTAKAVAEVNGRRYETLADAINYVSTYDINEDITLLRIFGEIVVVEDGAKASIVLGNGGSDEYGTYPSTWNGMNNDIPLTMNGGEITLKGGVLAQGQSGGTKNIAIKLAGGTLTVAASVTKIEGGAMPPEREFSIEATGGVLDLQGNTQLDGGLSISGDAQLKSGLKAGIFTNSDDDDDDSSDKMERISLKGDQYTYPQIPDSTKYDTVFDLLAEGYVFAKYDQSTKTTGAVIAKDTTTKSLTEDVAVIKCTHKDGDANLFENGTCPRCGLTCTKHNLEVGEGKCSVCGREIVANDGSNYYVSLNEAFERVADGGTLDALTNLPTIALAYDYGKSVALFLNGQHLTNNGADATLTVSAGKLTIEAAYSSDYPPTIINSGGGYAVKLTGGTLEFADNDYAKCSAVLKGGIHVTGNGKLEGSLKEGSILTKGSGSSSVSVEGADNYKHVYDLLPEGYAFAKATVTTASGEDVNTKTTKVGDIIPANVDKLTEDVIVVKCTHQNVNGNSTQRMFEKGVCTACGYVCPHEERTGDYCNTCGAQMVAKVGDRYFSTLTAAIEAAKNNGTVTLLKALTFVKESVTIGGGTKVTINMNAVSWEEGNATSPVLTVDGGSVTLNEGWLAIKEASSTAKGVVVVQSGSLTLGESMVFGDNGWAGPAIVVEGGDLTLGKGTKLYRGMKTSVTGKTLADYLPERTAFKRYDNNNQNGFITNGYVADLTDSIQFQLEVVSHTTHSAALDADGHYVCACGYTCDAHDFADGVCTKCGYACPHKNVMEVGTEGHRTASCGDCKVSMAVKVEYTDVNGTQQTKYYAQTYHTPNRVDSENTLQTILNDDTITPSGSTVTLLANDLIAFAFVDGGKTITLDLNGKNLLETGNGILVDTGSTLTVTGEGSSSDAGTDNTPCVFLVRGGTLEFTEMEFGGTFNSIRVGSGTLTSARDTEDAVKIGMLEIGSADARVSFKQGTFGKIVFSGNSGSVKLGDLLGMWKSRDDAGKLIDVRSGNAFQKDGKFLPYNKEITQGNPVENVKLAACNHDSVTNRTCDYCGTEHLVAVVIDGGGSIWNYPAKDGSDEAKKTSMGYAINSFNDHDASKRTLKLYVDFVIDTDVVLNAVDSKSTGKPIATQRIIDLNGNTITGGTLTANDLVTLTIEDNSENKGSISTPITVNGGASLTVESGISVGTITAADKSAKVTLKEGAKFSGYQLGEEMYLAQWLEDGCCVFSGSGVVNISGNGDGSDNGPFTVSKAPATFTKSVTSGTVRYNGLMPADVYPTITPDAGSNVSYFIVSWWYPIDGGASSLTSNTGTFYPGGSGTNFYGNVLSGIYNKFNIGDKLSDAYCVLTAKDSNNNALWKTVLHGYTFTLAAGNLADAEVTVSNADSLVFTPDANGVGTVQTLAFTVEHNGSSLKEGTDYQIQNNSNQAAQAGEHTLILEGLGNYTGTLEYQWEIAPLTLGTLAEQDSIRKDYDGTADLPGTFTFTPSFLVNNSWYALNPGDYTMEGSYDSATAGENKTATFQLTLTGDNYRFSNGQKTMEVAVSKDCNILKADAPTSQAGALDIVNHHKAAYTYDVSKLLPKLDGTKEYGGVTYSVYNVTLGQYYSSAEAAAVDANGLLTLPIQKNETDTVGKVGTVKVEVNSANYQTFYLTIHISASNKIFPTGAPTLSKTALTYGEKLSTITLSGAMKDGEATVQGTFAWTQPDAAPAAGSYAAEWKFTPADSSKYMEITGTVDITVNKATPSGAPKYTAVNTSGKTLADAALAVNDSWPDGSVKWVDKDGNDLPLDTEVTANTAYKWVFTPNDANNYNEISGSVTLYSVSTGGGGGGSTTTKTETTTNPDGSTTKTETKSDGTVVETTTNKDGSSTKTESKTETKSDGSTVETVTETRTEADGSKTTGKTETVTAKDGTKTETKSETTTAADGSKTETKSETATATDGSKTETKSETSTAKDGSKTETKSETKTDANGVTSGTETSTTTAANGSTGTTTTVIENGVSKTEAEAKISDKAVSDAKKSDEAVKIPTEVKAGGDSASAPTVKIDLPSSAGETKIEIPVKDVSAGTVAVIVHPDGTEELIKESLPTEGGVQLTVDGSVTVKIVDNAKDFKDTKNHWAADSIDFVSARGLVNGTGGDSFDPNAASTRAQLWTILARQIGADLTGGASWYEKAQEWAKANGISDGSNPDSSITRAQMVTMLWRAAGSPKADGANAFNDVPTGSYYADAIAWAAAHGITTGVGNGAFDPNGTCTRAQIAAFLHRSYLSE